MKPILFKSVIIFSITILYAALQLGFAVEPSDIEEKGKNHFVENCELCHGKNAKGDGVFAKLLTLDTPDLTQLRKDNDGVFPYKEVYLMIDGREEVLLHGPRYMPIWGDRFKSSTWSTVSEAYADTLVRGTIFELLIYLESIQEK